MKKKQFQLLNILYIFLLFINRNVYCAVDQILNDNFYQNPAELSLINQKQLIVGNIFIAPKFKYSGMSSGADGTATSVVNNSLPYALGSLRANDKIVFGLNVTPSVYGHLNWPINSIVSPSSTTTNALYYRIGGQFSYQFSNNLSVGIGLNLEDNKYFELNFVVPGLGNEINKISGLNYTADVGLLYKINDHHSFTAVIYSPVNTFGSGTSSLAGQNFNNFSMTISEASVASIGLRHLFTEKWFIEEKIYWSGWSLQKNLVFINSATGSYSVPTNWRDVWSFQITTNYSVMEKVGIIGSVMYETNPVPLETNSIGYPLAASGAISIGVDLSLREGLSTQILYSYGGFIPNSPINNATSLGMINAYFQACVLQFIYKN